jgi:chloramphenicol 3-O-phosphotransferase
VQGSGVQEIQQISNRRAPKWDQEGLSETTQKVVLNCIYHGVYVNPIELISDSDAFVICYNEERLHMGIGFVTPAEKHDGRAAAIIAARRVGMEQARERRLKINRGCSEGSDVA